MMVGTAADERSDYIRIRGARAHNQRRSREEEEHVLWSSKDTALCTFIALAFSVRAPVPSCWISRPELES